jgi:hypothetical protein
VVTAHGDPKVLKYQDVAAIGVGPGDMIARKGGASGMDRRTAVLRATTPLRGRNCRN